MDALARAIGAGERDDEARTRYQPLVTVVVAVAAGIVLDRYGRPDSFSAGDGPPAISWFTVWCWLSAGSLLTWWVAWRRRRSSLAAFPLLVAAACAGAARHHVQWELFGRLEAARYVDFDPGPACVAVIALESPQRVPAPRPTPLRAIPGGERSRLRVAIVGIRDGKVWRPASGECQLLVDGHLLGVHRSDRLRVFGQLARIGPPLNPGEFDFAAHARADRELVRMRSSVPESVTVMVRASRWRLGSVLDFVRGRAKQLVRTFVGPERAELAMAILLGDREGLTAEETEPYLLTGTIHVLVVSGLNVAVLAAGLYALMRIGWLPRRTGLAIIMVVVVAYSFLVETQPPVTRAAVFAVLICLGAWTGRRGVAFNSLAAAALVVLAINPADLFRAGPQLSFLAVAALVWIGHWAAARNAESSDRLDQLLAAARPWPRRALDTVLRWTGWLLVTSLAVWLVTLPLLLNQFHIASPVSVLISPAVWVVVFIAMWSGFLMLAVGWIVPVIGEFCGAVCSISLDWLEQLVDGAESLPGGHFWVPGPPWWWVVVFYLALLAVMIRGRALVSPRWQLAALCMWILIGLVPPLVRASQRDALDCSFVAVGHGACVVLQTPTGETLLYDAGSLGSPEFATQTIASYLWHRGIMRIDGIVISHADIDHYNAVPGLLERFRVGTVYVSPMMFDGFNDTETRGPDVLLDAIHDAGVPIRQVWSGDRLRVGPEVTLHVFHPPRRGVIGNDNSNSITLAVEHAGRRVLLPGDLESPGLEDVMAELPYDCDVLLAPHHGSRFSDPPGFAAWSTPEWVVISGGDDDIGPVVETYERAGAQVLVTQERGTVQFSLRHRPTEMASPHFSVRRGKVLALSRVQVPPGKGSLQPEAVGA
ncbi:MAG: ComEC/Rec2 family competence protein, partial [Planctomycetes bacterium]|nr:ComEC/Rec2 family competence protein [Planctomycetota bacterium]